MTVATHPTALDAFERIVRASGSRRLRPPPRLTVSEWADRHRMLSSEASAEPGRWITDRAPYQREPMDALGDPTVEHVVLLWASQTGKTEILLNQIGFAADLDPGPMMQVQPTIEMAEAYSKDRVAPMIRDTPRLTELFGDPTSRNSGNTLRHKPFKGGHLTMGGANSPASLAGRPIRYLQLDEVDRHPKSAGTEGSPRKLAIKRTQNFAMRKIAETSTPSVKGESAIEQSFDESDQRHYFVPCPECEHEQPLEWKRLRFKDLPEPKYECAECGHLIGEEFKHQMLARGHWVALNPGAAKRGYRLNALYSPWATWASLRDDFLSAQGNPLDLQVFVNTVLAETWEERGDSVGVDGLAKRREKYPFPCPPGVVAITAGVDVQADRIEVYHRGWGVGEESWLLGHEKASGDTTTAVPWEALDELVWKEFATEDGEVVTAIATGIDSGHATESVLRWGTPRLRRGVYILKGGSDLGRPLVGKKPTVSGKGRGRIWMVGTDTSQGRFYGQLRIMSPGPGFIHLPDWIDDDQIGQMTAEVKKSVKSKNKWVKRWVLPRGLHNEAADCMRYADVARELGNLSLARLAKLAARRQVAAPDAPVDAEGAEPQEQQPPPAPAPKRRRPRRSGWVSGWKN